MRLRSHPIPCDARVAACGRVCVHRRKIDGSTVMAGQRPGSKAVGDGLRVVTFMTDDTDDRDYMDLEQKDPQPADNRLGAKVLPVSQAGLVLSPMSPGWTLKIMERAMGIEPTTLSLGK